MSFKTVFLIHILATAFMAGVIWIVQIVHYPLFEQVGKLGFQDYINDHSSRITWIVFPLMTIELITGLLLVFKYELPFDPKWAYIGLALLAIIWISTALVQVPVHNKLSSSGFNTELIHQLVAGNWIRTISWTLRLALVFYLSSLSFKLLLP